MVIQEQSPTQWVGIEMMTSDVKIRKGKVDFEMIENC